MPPLGPLSVIVAPLSHAIRDELACRSIEAACMRSWSEIGVGDVVRRSPRSNVERTGLIEREGDSDRTGDASRELLARESDPGSVAWESVIGA